MEKKTGYLRAVHEGVNIKKFFNPEFLEALKNNFGEDYKIIPFGLAFTIEKEDVTKDTVNLVHKNDENIENNILMVDLHSSENMDKILKTLDLDWGENNE